MAQISKSIGTKTPRAGKRLALGAFKSTAGKPATSQTRKLISTELPGWKIVADQEIAPAPMEEDMQSDQGPSIADLRRKFLTEDDADAPAGEAFADVDQSVETVRVQPRNGGPVKTADIKNGKVAIVQG